MRDLDSAVEINEVKEQKEKERFLVLVEQRKYKEARIIAKRMFYGRGYNLLERTFICTTRHGRIQKPCIESGYMEAEELVRLFSNFHSKNVWKGNFNKP